MTVEHIVRNTQHVVQLVVQGSYFLGTLLAHYIASKLYVFMCVCECIYARFYEESSMIYIRLLKKFIL